MTVIDLAAGAAPNTGGTPLSTGVIDLFAGPGGWDQGLAMLGRRDVVGVEWDGPACETAVAAGHARVKADVAKLDPGAFAVEHGWTGEGYVASPPCQSFSAAGKGRGRAHLPLILAAVEQIAAGRHPRGVLARLRYRCEDPRTALVVEPLHWALDLRPQWVALEQVPPVLPLWEAFAEVLRGVGYQVATGNLQAEMFGVPQTRKRAVLIASLVGPIALPAPTHSRYHPRDPQRLDPGVAKWISMAQALTAAGLQLPGEEMRSNYGTGGDPAARGVRSVDEPCAAVTSKIGRNMWTVRTGSFTAVAPEATAAWMLRELPTWCKERPATTVQGDPRIWPPGHKVNGDDRRRLGEEADERYGDRAGSQAVRVTVAEAAVLQSFPADYPFVGNKGQQYRQVGDAKPPLMAAHVLQATGAGRLVVDLDGAA